MPLGSTSVVISHWYKLVDGLQASPSEVYKAVEEIIQTHKIPDSVASRVDWAESGPFAARREYLRMTRGRHVIDVCAAPFGNGFFFSWWLAEERPSPIVPSLAALGAIVLIGYAVGFFATLLILVTVFFVIGGFMSQSTEEDWIGYAIVIPVFGPLWERIFLPFTYYRIDTALMFQQAIHTSVMEVIDGMTQAKGLRALSEADRKPILKDFFQR
jgi:hypothetical protein